MHEYSEVSQLRTQCTILESQINVLKTKNVKLQERIEQLEKSVPKYKEIPNVGKFPVDYTTLGPDDGDFQL
jgi:chaperonin cofactor prefoldin|tara:strand:- start:462 stop:674 length:213 start_codon:yes stop_codon:yes gene_type:complete